MAKPRIRAYFAVSVDGMIADQSGGVSWLTPFEQVDVGFDQFLASIDTIAMGRRTYDQIQTFGEWPYQGKDVIVVTSRSLGAAPRGVRSFHGGPDALARQVTGGDMWVCGGSRLFNAMLGTGHIDRIELFVIPVLLGGGLRLFTADGGPANLRLRGAKSHPMGMVEMVYEFIR